LVPACLVLAPEAEGATIVTIEGIAGGETLHPLQRQFLSHAALQCGVCTPGFIVAAKALLDANPNPTEADVRYALAGNLCRCTGYDKIVRAVLDAADEVRQAGPCVGVATPEVERDRASAGGRDRSVTGRVGVGPHEQ
jgi:carbon-monoxide dehydrogenase small subunit